LPLPQGQRSFRPIFILYASYFQAGPLHRIHSRSDCNLMQPPLDSCDPKHRRGVPSTPVARLARDFCPQGHCSRSAACPKRIPKRRAGRISPVKSRLRHLAPTWPIRPDSAGTRLCPAPGPCKSRNPLRAGFRDAGDCGLSFISHSATSGQQHRLRRNSSPLPES
jgi:hypothetical protein